MSRAERLGSTCSPLLEGSSHFIYLLAAAVAPATPLKPGSNRSPCHGLMNRLSQNKAPALGTEILSVFGPFWKVNCGRNPAKSWNKLESC